MPDCPVTQHHIKVAEDMFGPNLGSLRGKTAWRKVKHVRSQVDLGHGDTSKTLQHRAHHGHSVCQ